MLKVDLHLHAKEDKEDIIHFYAKELIDKAGRLGYDVLSFTFHDRLFWNAKMAKYAEKKGILLIPGIEKVIENSEVLLYNITQREIKALKTFNDLAKLKKKNKKVFAIAPHPYFPVGKCLRKKLEKNINLFDAIELSWFYTKHINCNKKAIAIAEKYKKPLIATSDTHVLSHFGNNYANIDSKKDSESMFQAIKDNKINNSIQPRSMLFFGLFSLKIILLDGVMKKTKKYLYDKLIGRLIRK
jgi:predicted metal-dependent phosphoesterase TrpH